MKKEEAVIIGGVEYVPKSSVALNAPAKSVKGMKYCVVRGYQSGVWAGYVKSQEGVKVIIVNARNLWYWKGAASLAQLTQEGIKNLTESKITQEVPEFTMLDANTVIACSEVAKTNIVGAPVWKA
jgi:hypothetical protein